MENPGFPPEPEEDDLDPPTVELDEVDMMLAPSQGEKLPHPGMYPDDRLGRNLFADFCHVFVQSSINNDYFASGCFHLIVGQLPNIRKIRIMRHGGSYLDPRMHVAFLAPSASGKGEGTKVVARFAEHLGLKVEYIDNTTNAGLIGTNTMSNTGEIQSGVGWIHPDSGIDIFIAKEGTNILKDPSKDTEARDLLNSLQTMMNDLGSDDNRITKKLAHGEVIRFNPVASLCLTSYPVSYMDETMLESGFFQRMYFYSRETTSKDRQADMKILMEKQLSRSNPLPFEEEIAQRLAYINQQYAGVEEMWPTPAALEVFRQQNEEIEALLARYHPATQDMLASFTGRFPSLYQKAAMHFACLNLHKNIEKEDAELATYYTQKLFEEVTATIYMRSTPNKKTVKMIDQVMERTKECYDKLLHDNPIVYAKSNGFVHSDYLCQAINKKYRAADNVSRTYLKKLESWNLGEFREQNGTQFFRLAKDLPMSDKPVPKFGS